MFKKENVQFCVGAAAGITVGLIAGKLLSSNLSYSNVTNIQAPIHQDNSIPKNDKLYTNKQECCCSKSVIEYKDIKSKDSIILTPIKSTLRNAKINVNSATPVKNMSLNKIPSTSERVKVSEEITKLSYEANTTYIMNTHREPYIENVEETKMFDENTFPSYLMPEENQQAFNNKFVNIMDITGQSVNFINMKTDSFTNNYKDTFNNTDTSQISCDLEMNSMNYVDNSVSFPNISKMAMCNTVFNTSTLIDYESLNQSNEFNECNLVSSTMNDISINF